MKNSALLTTNLLSTLLILPFMATAQTGAGAGMGNTNPTVSAPSTSSPSNRAPNTTSHPSTTLNSNNTQNMPTTPSTSAPTTNSTSLPGTSNPTSGAIRMQEPSVRPCPPTNSAGGADRPRIAGNLSSEGTNCPPTPGTQMPNPNNSTIR